MSGDHAFAVIGAGGFIGSRIVEILHLDRGVRVRPVVRRASSLALARRFAIDARVADARDEAGLTAALRGCDVVVHATAGDPRSIVAGVAPVYRAASAAGCRRLVYLSSAMVVGQSPRQGTDETTPLSLRQPIAYNRAKVRAEQTLFGLRREGGLEVVALRPGIVFGPRSAWIGDFADALLSGRALLVEGGEGLCNAVYVDNVVHAVELAAAAANADGEAFFIGEEERMTWREFYEPLARAFGHDISEIVSVPAVHAPRSLKERIDDVRLSAPVQALLNALPAGLRRAVGAAWKGTGALPDVGTGPLRPTLETILLQTSRWAPSWAKARAVLGYEPVVSREEAFRRSVGWLAFAGYPVVTAESAGGGRVHNV